MSAALVRGHWLIQTGELVRALRGEDSVRADALAKLDELAEHVSTFQANGWYPRRLHVQLLSVIAAASTDERAARDRLLRCGHAVATRSHDPFLQLALKIMTMPLLAASLSKLWALDHAGDGAFTVEECARDARRAAVRLSGVGDYDHVGVVAEGWMMSLIQEMGVAGAAVTQTGWTSAQPAPAEVRFELRWP